MGWATVLSCSASAFSRIAAGGKTCEILAKNLESTVSDQATSQRSSVDCRLTYRR